VEPVDAVIVIVPLRVRPGIGCVAAWLTLQEYIFEKTMEIGEKAWTMRAACQEREWSQYFECTSVGRRGAALCADTTDDLPDYLIMYLTLAPTLTFCFSFLTNTIESWIAAPLNNIACFTSQLLNHLPTQSLHRAQSLTITLNQSPIPPSQVQFRPYNADVESVCRRYSYQLLAL
jgi:hypothetical protein